MFICSWKLFSDNQWIGVMHNHVWILTQTDDNIMYKVIGPIAKHGECNEQMKKKKKIEEPGEEYFTDLLKDYFLMDIKLDDISSHWCKAGKCLIFLK